MKQALRRRVTCDSTCQTNTETNGSLDESSKGASEFKADNNRLNFILLYHLLLTFFKKVEYAENILVFLMSFSYLVGHLENELDNSNDVLLKVFFLIILLWCFGFRNSLKHASTYGEITYIFMNKYHISMVIFNITNSSWFQTQRCL